MKLIANSVVFYMLLVFVFKFFGTMSNNSHVNYYWIFSSIFNAVIFYKLQDFCNLTYFKSKYNPDDLKLYKLIFLILSIYWGVMVILRIYIAFNIEQYTTFISSARQWTVGGCFIAVSFIFLISKLKWFKG